MKNLCQGYSQTVYFNRCRLIPHTTVCKRLRQPSTVGGMCARCFAGRCMQLSCRRSAIVAPVERAAPSRICAANNCSIYSRPEIGVGSRRRRRRHFDFISLQIVLRAVRPAAATAEKHKRRRRRRRRRVFRRRSAHYSLVGRYCDCAAARFPQEARWSSVVDSPPRLCNMIRMAFAIRKQTVRSWCRLGHASVLCSSSFVCDVSGPGVELDLSI